MASKIIAKREKIDIFLSILVNFFTLLVSVLVGFYIPKYMSVETFANYRTYCLYAGYVGFFHLGFINGVYLKYGSFDYDELPKRRFRAYTRILFVSQIVFQIILIGILFWFKGTTILISPFFFVIIFIFLSNVNIYFLLIDQFTKRFRLDMLIQLLQSVLMGLGFVILLICKVDNYIPFLLVILLENIISLIILCSFNKELIWGGGVDYKGIFKDVGERVANGFFVMLGEFLGIFVVTIDVLIVNLFMSVMDFSIYSFAYSIIAFLFQLSSVIAKFVFPYLKRTSEEKRKDLYDKMKSYVLLYSAIIAGLSLFICYLIPLFIPQYKDSILIIRILGILILFRGIQELVCSNYFKVLDEVKSFTKVYMVALLIALVTDAVAFLMFHSMIAIAVASVCTFAIWFLISDRILQTKLNRNRWFSNLIVFIVGGFYYFCSFLPTIFGVILYYVVLLVAFIIVWKKDDFIRELLFINKNNK